MAASVCVRIRFAIMIFYSATQCLPSIYCGPVTGHSSITS